MVIDKRQGKYVIFCFTGSFYRFLSFFYLKFADILLIVTVFVVSVISSHITIESSIILSAYLAFLQLHLGWFQV